MSDEELPPAMAYAIGVTVRQIVEREIVLPDNPRDGDCLTYAPMITRLLCSADLPAYDALVTGWFDAGANVIWFLHHATVVDGGVVVDGTTRQFNPELPVLLVTTVDNYAMKMAEWTRVPLVTVEWRTG